MQTKIQPFKESEYSEYIKLVNSIYPKHPINLEGKLHADKTREKKIFFKRWVIQKENKIIAALVIDQWQDTYHPDKYVMNIYVKKNHENKGIGNKLYSFMENQILTRNPVKITSEVWEPHNQSTRFLEKRGYKLGATEKEFLLDLQKYNPLENKSKIKRVIESGYKLLTLEQLRKKDQNTDKKVWEFERDVSPDMPWTDQITVMDYPIYLKQVLQHPKFEPRAWILAVKDGEIAGLNNLWKSNLKGEINNGLTGVRRKHRRKGVATALKHINLKWAKKEGYHSVKTENESTNNGMLNINLNAGFKLLPSWLYFHKVFRK